MSEIIVTSQDELDAALDEHGDDLTAHIVIDSPAGVRLSLVRETPNRARVSVRGVSQVGPVGGSATVSGVRDSATVRDVRDSATVRGVRDSATVRDVWDSATVSGVGDSATVRDVRGSATVRDVRGSATVRDVWDSATVSDVWGSATVSGVRDSATVRDVRGSATVSDVGGSATVRDVWGSATVSDVWGSATVSDVGGSATVRGVVGTASLRLSDCATAEHVGPHVTVMVHSVHVTVDGGHIVDLSGLDQHDPEMWIDLVGARRDGDAVLLYKAVDDDYMAGHGHIVTRHPVGETVTATDWRADHDCGGGLHVSPTPYQARSYATRATRMLLVRVPVATLRSIGLDKCKTPTLTVVREVTLDGDEIEVTA